MATIGITCTETGWHIEAEDSNTGTFTADLDLCTCDPTRKGFAKTLPCETRPESYRNGPAVPGGYHRSHVENMLKGIARTYSSKTIVPAVPMHPKG